MHAVVVKVRIQDDAAARAMLSERVVPMVSGAPGFVTGTWLDPQDGQGFSVAVFESEDAARAMSEQIDVPPDAPVELVSVELRAVAAHA